MSSKVAVLVVEDEEIARKAMELMLKYNCPNVEQVMVAANGIEALELFRREQVDIVLMDINLPGANGLETIRQMKMISNRARYVIVSAYNKFEYAQEAIRQDIVDFLVKPIQLDDLREVIAKLAEEIAEIRNKSQHVELQKEKFQTIRPLLENDLIYGVASVRENISIPDVFDFLQMSPVSGCVAVVAGELCTIQFLQNIRKRLRIMGLECLGDMLNDLGVLVILSDHLIQPQQLREILLYLLNTIAEGHIHMGIGKITDPDENLKSSFHQASFAVQYAESKNKSLMFFSELRDSEVPEMVNVQTVATVIAGKICEGEELEIPSLLDAFFNALQVSMIEEDVISNANCLYSLVVAEVLENGISAELFEIKKMRKCLNAAAIKGLMLADFMGAAELQQTPARTLQSIHSAIHLIHTQYMNNISLESVAKKINYTPYYLSRLFKKHTGSTFTEYLSNYRIEQSKKLIREGELSMKEIAASVGFNSQGYFTKIFKKHTGISPSEFK